MITAEEIRNAMRISSTVFDDDINAKMQAAVLDMSNLGIDVENKGDALTDQCITDYVCWKYNYLDKGETFHQAYVDLRDTLSFSSKYLPEDAT